MNVKLFTPYKAQREFIDSFVDTDDLFGTVVAPRGSGKSLLAMNIILYWALGKDNQKCAWVAPTFSQAKSILDSIVTAAKDVIETSNRMEATISFINGSTIKFLSADSADNIRGFRFNYVVVDEAAYIKETTLTTVILPTLNPNGKKCLLISTPKGKNHFFTWYNKAEVVSKRFKLEECPYVSKELIEEARKSLPTEIFRQEYEAAFVDSSNDVFTNIDNVSTVTAYDTKRQDVFVGIDTGLSDDYSVLTILNTVGRVLWIETLNNLPLQEIADRFASIMRKYNVVGGNIEVNGIGAAMYDQLGKEFKRVKRFNTSQDNKTLMVRKMISDIEATEIELPTINLCPALHSEFGTYTYKMSANGKLSFSHANGAKDDHVDSLMLANFARNQFVERRPISISGIKRVNATFGMPT